MCDVQRLRASVQQRLTAAAEEIFELFLRSIAEYEKTLCRQRELLDAVSKPRVRSHGADVHLLSVCREGPPEQQEWICSLDQDYPPELPYIKEEQQKLWTSQEGVQSQGLEEADVIKFTITPVLVKSEQYNEEIPQSSQIHHTVEKNAVGDGEDHGRPEQDRNFNPDSNSQSVTVDDESCSSEIVTDVNCDWEETSKLQSGANSLRNNGESECFTGIIPITTSEVPTSFGHKRHLQELKGVRVGAKTFSCSICGKIYTRKNSLTGHMRLHSEGKRFSCTVCQKTFPYRANLIMHIRVHTGEKPFSCSVCGRRFAVNANLRKHTRIHNREKPFSCSVCGKSFTQLSEFKQHKCIR